MSGGRAPAEPAERVALGACALSAAAAVGLAAVYLAGGQPQAEGALLAVSLVGLGVALVLWAALVLPQDEHTEEREVLPTTAEERAGFEAALERGGALGRRRVLLGAMAAAGGALAAAFLLPVRSLGPSPGRRLLETPWRGGARLVGEDGRPVRADEVPVDGLVTVFPEGHAGSADGQAVLVRVPPGLLRLPRGRRAWAPDGLVAYSKVCTHAGCPVGLYQARTFQLLCPCHQSAFDVLDGARPVFGPAAWPLPQLPLRVDDQGVLWATADFSEPVGPGWWKA